MAAPAGGGGEDLGPFTDAEGRPFYLTPEDHKVIYLSPATAPGGGQAPPGKMWDQNSGQWVNIPNQLLQKLTTYGVGGLLGAGVLSAAGVFGGAAGTGAGAGTGSSGGTLASAGGVGLGETGATMGISPAVASSLGPTVGPVASAASGAGPFAFLKNPTVLGSIFSGVGMGINAWQTNKAVNAQEKAAADALALQKEMYDTTRADQKPYRDAGSAAERYRGYLLGLPGYDTPSSGAQPVTEAGGQSVFQPGVGQIRQNEVIRNPDGSIKQINGSITQRDTSGSVPVTPEGQRPSNLSMLSRSGAMVGGQAQMVTVKSPTGQVGQIPANRLQDALAAGGVQV